MTDEFSKLIQQHEIRGWLGAYLDHTRDMEAHTSFHFFTALAVLGAVLKRRVYVDQIKFKLFPCYQVLISGPAGEAKKTTAANYGVRIGEATGEVTRLMSSGSPEKLWDRLHKLTMQTGSACGMLYAGEASTLLNKRDYASTMVEMLMELFDCPEDLPPRETFAHGSQPLKNVAVSCIFCSNEIMIASAMPEHAMRGGLPSRMITLNEQDSGGRTVPLLDEMPAPPTSRDWMISELTRFRFVTGKAAISNEGRVWFREWYGKLRARRKSVPDENMKPFFSRYSDHMLRVALGLSVQEMPDPQVPVIITDKHFLQADAVLEYVVERMPELYRFLGMGPFGTDYAKILALLMSAGGEMERSELGRKMSYKLSRPKLHELLDTLIMNGDMEMVKRNHEVICRMRTR